jgi:hypothetical protein
MRIAIYDRDILMEIIYDIHIRSMQSRKTQIELPLRKNIALCQRIRKTRGYIRLWLRIRKLNAHIVTIVNELARNSNNNIFIKVRNKTKKIPVSGIRQGNSLAQHCSASS